MPTRTQLRDIVRQDESIKSTDVISDANLNTLLNESAVQFAKDGHPFVVKASWSTAASTQEYILSGASAKVSNFLDVYWPTGGLIYEQTSTAIKLPPQDFTVVSELWLNREYPGWRGLTASDVLQHVYFTYDTNGYLNLGVVPKSSTTTPTFRLWFISRGTDMSDDANYPYTNTTTLLTHVEPYLKGIAYWAMHVLHRDKTKLDAEAAKYLQLYSAVAQACREAQERFARAELHGLREEDKLISTQSFGSL